MDIPPDKLFFKIGEVAAAAGVATSVLRYWESEFAPLRPRKGVGGQRVYRREDVEMVFVIRRMLYEQGYTISGARKCLNEAIAERHKALAQRKPDVPLKERAAGEEKKQDDRTHKARKGLRELLDIMENTDSLRAHARDESGRGAVR